MNIRTYNNQVKNFLLRSCHGSTLFDIEVGKAGDLHKWVSKGLTRVVGVDINPGFIKEAWQRKQSKEHQIGHYLDYHFFAHRQGDFDSFIVQEEFDIVSCQFAMHYFFGNWQDIDLFFQCVGRRLKQGGAFICTVLNGDRLPKPRFKTALFESVQDKSETHKIHVGIKDTPYFQGRLIPEYLIYENTLLGAAELHGLRLHKKHSFESLRSNVRVELTKEEKDVCFLYDAYIFVKT